MILPEKLVYLRKQKGLSQEELAEKMALSRQSISRWESGGAVPGIDSLKLLSRLYGVSVDYLLDDRLDAPTDTTPQETPEPVPTVSFLRKYGWFTAFILTLIVALILLWCLLNMRRLSEDHIYSFREVSTCREGDGDEYSEGTFSLECP